MPDNVPPSDTPATDWLLAQTEALMRIRAEHAQRRAEVIQFYSEASAARNSGYGCPIEDQQAQEMNQ